MIRPPIVACRAQRQDGFMPRPLNPPAIRPPFARYSHGIEIPPGARLVYCSGQLGVGADDRSPG